MEVLADAIYCGPTGRYMISQCIVELKEGVVCSVLFNDATVTSDLGNVTVKLPDSGFQVKHGPKHLHIDDLDGFRLRALNLHVFPAPIADMLFVHTYNMPFPGRPNATDTYYFDSAKGWNYLRAGKYDDLVCYTRDHADQVRSYYMAEAKRLGRAHERFCGPLHTWHFLATEAGVLAETPAQASAEAFPA